MNRDQVRAIFVLAGLAIFHLTELADQYCGRPGVKWWLVTTEHGVIKIGPRKRVYSIDWENTDHECIVHKLDTTVWRKGVHAYNFWDAVKFLSEFNRLVVDRGYSNMREEMATDVNNDFDRAIATGNTPSDYVLQMMGKPP